MSDMANNIYDSLFNGKSAPLSKEAQSEFDRITAEIELRNASMTEEEKIARFNQIMGRN